MEEETTCDKEQSEVQVDKRIRFLYRLRRLFTGFRNVGAMVMGAVAVSGLAFLLWVEEAAIGHQGPLGWITFGFTGVILLGLIGRSVTGWLIDQRMSAPTGVVLSSKEITRLGRSAIQKQDDDGEKKDV